LVDFVAYVLPLGTRVRFRLKEIHDIRQLSVELQPDFVLGAVGFEPSVRFDVIETWDCGDLLSWQLARVICGECTSHTPQGALYAETAATRLAMHLVRNLSTMTICWPSETNAAVPGSWGRSVFKIEQTARGPMV
jgi:hypothetical protein